MTVVDMIDVWLVLSNRGPSLTPHTGPGLIKPGTGIDRSCSAGIAASTVTSIPIDRMQQCVGR